MSPSRSLVRLVGSAALAAVIGTGMSLTGASIPVAASAAVCTGGTLLMLPRWRRAVLILPASAMAAIAAALVDLPLLPWVIAAIAMVGAAPDAPSATAGQRVSSAAVAAIIAVAAMFCAAVIVPLGPEPLAAGLLSALALLSVGIGQAISHLDTTHNRVPHWRVRHALTAPHRPPVFRALHRAAQGWTCTQDTDIRSGLDEVSTWVFTLQVHQQAITRDLSVLSSTAPASDTGPVGTDTFAAKQLAAASSLRARQQDHVRTLQVEAERTAALVDYALAWLDDAVASLTVAQRTAQVAPPIDMDRVLGRLRAHEREQDALRRTVVELA